MEKWFQVVSCVLHLPVISSLENDRAPMSSDEEVSRSELFELIHYFSKYPFRARDTNSKVN